MKTVNSISGGMTSSFMALHFPADHDIFACVEQEAFYMRICDREERNKYAYMLREASDWLRLFNPSFEMSAEDDRTLIVLNKLSRELGTDSRGRHSMKGKIEVVFARDWGLSKFKTYDDMVKERLPNSQTRMCTEHLKIVPMYNYIRNRISKVDPVEMRIGFRLDELDRTINMFFRVVEIKDRIPNPSFRLDSVITDCQIPSYLVKWWDIMDVEGMVRRGERVLKPNPFNYYKKDFYRVPSFPLIEHGITKAEIVKYWKGRPEYVFPQISNCVMCFHHTIQQLQQQWNDPINWNKMKWADEAEKDIGNTFKRRQVGKRTYPASMDWIKNLPIQMQLEFIDFASCDAGTCTD